jgi:ParB family chromosome partitioning protein
MMAGSLDKKVEYVDLEKIRPNPYQPRKKFNNMSLEELAASIKAYGVLQPITLRKMSDGYYELIAGERRVKASGLVGLTKIPAIVMEVMDHDSAVLALIENLQREDLNFFEEAEGYCHLMDDYGFTQEEIAKKVGKNQSTIANKIRLLRLSKAVRNSILQGGLTERHARALLKIPQEDMQIVLLKKIVEKNLKVKETEDLIESVLKKMAYKQNKIKEDELKRSIKGVINYKIYVNTIKNAYKAIKQSGIEAEFFQRDLEDYIEVVVKIPKNSVPG